MRSGDAMRPGATIGLVVCMALTGGAAAAVAAFVSMVVCPPVLLVAYAVFWSHPDDRPFLWLAPMGRLAAGFALVGACVGVARVWRHAQRGGQPEAQEPPRDGPTRAHG